ncbi:hypothetical protein IDH27_03775 [Pelagibacterales bacterium SAG-MED46]|nr:hypothetical protein [Pelagibacterales bacterium SAG-MED46]
MKFKFKYLLFKKLYIYFCFIALINIFFSTENIRAKTFAVSDIEISTPFEINFDKNDIIDQGFIKAFNYLILSIVQTKDQKKLKSISLGLIKEMIETFSIKEEKFINEIYYLSLNVSFNKKKVFHLLEKKNIFPSILIKKKVLLIPIILDEYNDEILIFSESSFYKNWNSSIKKYHLLEYILPSEDLEDFNLIKSNSKNLENYDFREIIQKYNLEDYIITIVFKNNNQIRVLNKIKFNEKITFKNLRFQNLTLNDEKEIKEFTNKLKTMFENYWKVKNQINTSVKISLTISIDNNNNLEISKFEEILDDIDLIYDFYISKFDNKNNIYKVIFNGSPDYFLKIMKDFDYEFDTQHLVWALK